MPFGIVMSFQDVLNGQFIEIQSAPADHFQSLFAIWKHIVELEKQSEGNLIGWVIEIDELSVDSPEMSHYANILVSLAGEPVISDPLLLEADPSNNAHARLGWLAPEVIKGEPLTQASDVYSLGMTILEVLGGVPTDLEGNYAEALNVELIYDLESVLPERPEKYIPTNSRDGDDLWKLLSRCCSANPSGRPITDWVAEIMQMITQDGLQERYTLQESGNDPCFEPRGNAFKKESLELSDVESVSSSSSDTNFRHSALNGLAIHDPSVADQGLLGTESRIMARKILKQLATHGCENLTDHMNQGSFSVLPLFRGGFGDVYRGNLLGGLKVAVKTPQVSLNILEENPNYLKDVAREIHTWSKCDHPNVLHFLGLAEFRGQIGMVAPWMESGSLPRYLKKAFRADRCKLCTQICEGVAYLHEIGIVHGDLKGENVLISADGVAVISDFGGSLLRNRSLNIIPLEKGSCLTYRWAAPELLLQGEMDEIDDSSSTTGTRVSQNSAKCPLNTRESDIYALGMTILEIISGKLPWYWIKNEPAIITHVCSPGKLHKRPQQIPVHSPGGNKLWKLLNECWSYKPDVRPTAIEVRNAVRTISPGALKAYPPPATGNRCALFGYLY
ncbi:putative LRR receptor-like serine/threonine-protein kinase At4g36180 [Rhizoctonia solani]|uniref:Putative LRR receptor-like serine/threonine-protein kinase At4g36180 n=1 Tax=Rhizoctonia solani TaxID=456999 RepID=A0A0K6G417_9AGAM|nr:putative LRR receptor-like serine/threonine-protein kinase At4g36180 [Rhizoctonia solani]